MIMTEFEHLKNSYTCSVRVGMHGVNFHDAMKGNEFIHSFCKMLVDRSNYTNEEKAVMKLELDFLKETLSNEIKSYYQNEQ